MNVQVAWPWPYEISLSAFLDEVTLGSAGAWRVVEDPTTSNRLALSCGHCGTVVAVSGLRGVRCRCDSEQQARKARAYWGDLAEVFETWDMVDEDPACPW